MSGWPVAYICDGTACNNPQNCYLVHGGPCSHTFDPTHALNGRCTAPALQVDRFSLLKGPDGGFVLWERGGTDQ